MLPDETLLKPEDQTEGDQKPEGDDRAKQPEPSQEPKKATDAELEAGLKDFLGDPGVSEDEKLATQKGYNRLTDQAKAARETARIDAEAERQRAKAEADEIRANAVKEANDISNIAIAKKMVKSGKWTKDQANEFLEEEGVDQGFDQDKLLTKVSEVVAHTVASQREADRKASENARIAAEKPLWMEAARKVETACPRLNLQEIGYFLGKQYNAGVKPDDAVKAISERFGSVALPKNDNETVVPDDTDKLADERKKRYLT